MMNPRNYGFKFVIQVTFFAWLVMLMLQVCGEGEGEGDDHQCIERERRALLEFKASVVEDYGKLSSWEDQTDCCQWEGVGCSNYTGHIQTLDLHGYYTQYGAERLLRGIKFSTSLVKLQQLRYLNLSSNDFRGTHIPQFFASLTNLRYLDLSSAGFVGNIPTQFGSLSHLKYLNLQSNYLEGSIPHQLGNLSKLQFLYLDGNSLQGTIPSQLGNLSNLHHLHLAYNDALKIGDGGHCLSNLTSLTHLDLSYLMNLNTSRNWIQMIGNLSKLKELILVGCSLSDHFIIALSPYQSKFPYSLSVLDLSENNFISSSAIFQWLSNVTSNLVELNLKYNLLEVLTLTSNDFGASMKSLKRLDLFDNIIKGVDLKSLTNICTLSSLDLSQNNLAEDLPSILHNLSAGCVSRSLQELYLSQNQITGLIPDDLSIFPSLKWLSLSYNQLKGKVPENILLPSQLVSLDINSNSIEGEIPKLFGNTCTLNSLDMSNNYLSQKLPVIIQHLSGCASLQVLDLRNNQINGTLPDLSIFPSLRELYLDGNKLNGRIPKDIQLPSELEVFAINSNSLEGVFTNFHFGNLSKLKVLSLSENSLVLAFGNNWVPPFQLQELYLRNCKLGPSFPKWLQTQVNLMKLDISNAGILNVVPEGFWALSRHLSLMNISYNNLSGIIPNFPLRFTDDTSISLAANQFEGPIPLFLRSAASLDLSDNKFSDFALFVCANGTTEGLGQLDISSNHLSGQIPNCWSKFKSLTYIDLSNNNLSGEFPTSMGLALQLEVLILRNNSLTGELPFSLKSCTNLSMLDAGENRLSGVIPSWIGSSLQQLLMLSLRRNHFFGSLPSSLCYLTDILLLDLSANRLNGRIPKCFNNFTSMTQEEISERRDGHTYCVGFVLSYSHDLIASLMWKGTERIFNNDNLLLKGIDLSSNQLSEQIPTQLGSLVELVSLNLSRNNLTGEIPMVIGNLKSLDSLDLSRNHLVGSIPSSLAQIDRLSVLDLSHNNLSGKIPVSTQLQSYNASCYEENQDLCGPPLAKMCFEEEPHDQEPSDKTEEDEHDPFLQTFYLSMGLGFFVGFWGIFGTILFNRSWRHTYFRFLNNLSDKILSRRQ